jgi:23S rRNA pseudouridine1911/1915/1917 synthase
VVVFATARRDRNSGDKCTPRTAGVTLTAMGEPGWTVASEDAGTRLDKFLAHPTRLGSRARAAAAIERGKAYLNGALVTEGAIRLSAGDTVRVWMDKPGSARRPTRPGPRGELDIVYEDEVLLVVNKPAGLLTVPLERKRDVPSVYDQIESYLRPAGRRRPFVVHRIDQETSGLVVFAKDAVSQGRLKAQFKRREPERAYWTVVYGRPEPPSGAWRDRLVWDTTALIQKETHPRDPQGTDAVSEYATVEAFANASLLEVRLVTGRRNQIRIQARLRGHTLVGEQRYTYGPDSLRTIPFGRHALHARRLSFRHPVDDRLLAFEAPPPPDFAELLARLRKGRLVS